MSETRGAAQPDPKGDADAEKAAPAVVVHPFQSLSDESIDKLVKSLASLTEGELAVTMLVACGTRAVEPLRRLLLEGKAVSVAEPRRRAVRALAELGEVDTLLEYLTQPRAIPDPILRLSEETVQSLAARCVMRWRTEKVRHTLLELAARHMLPGVAEALGTCHVAEAIPYLVRALGDDINRGPAAEALTGMMAEAQPWLVAAALHPEPSSDQENASSLRRRRRALRLLLEAGNIENEWIALRPLLHDRDADIAVTSARLGLKVSQAREELMLIGVLLQFAAVDDWLLQSEISDALVAHYVAAEPLIRKAVAQRKASAGGWDRGLAILHEVLRHGEGQK
ncbi:MAG TPA: hypothetical protein VNK82_00055 [Terriglobales bacterium]|nr:hypothetical protein [Terriglobales bacterium]